MIPGDRITAVQLCDATAQVPEGMSLAYDGVNNRRVPGDGEFPIDEVAAWARNRRDHSLSLVRQTG